MARSDSSLKYLANLTEQWLKKEHPNFIRFEVYQIQDKDPYHPMNGQWVVKLREYEPVTKELKLGTTFEEAEQFLIANLSPNT